MFEDIFAFLEAGGPVLTVILVVSTLLWTLIIERYWFFRTQAAPMCVEFTKAWHERSDHEGWHGQKIRMAMVSKVTMAFEENMSVIRLLVMVCPLLGLLGTVTGMISVFDVMAVTGTGNARAMAAGISQATIPTMAGMVVSLIGLYFKARFEGMANKQLDIFQDRLVK